MMEFFSVIDWTAIFKIVGIDIMLGVDNAVVIALACAALAPEVRNKAIALGTAGAIALRAALLAFAGLLIGITGVKLVAGLYLFYIGYSLLVSSEEEDPDVPKKTSIWGAVGTVIVADFMMSLDNVLAVVGAAQSTGQHSTLYAIAGIVLSIPIIILGAKGIMSLMDKFPIITWLGACLLGWVGAEMILTEPLLKDYVVSLSHTADIVLKLIGFSLVGAAAYIKLSMNKAINAAA